MPCLAQQTSLCADRPVSVHSCGRSEAAGVGPCLPPGQDQPCLQESNAATHPAQRACGS